MIQRRTFLTKTCKTALGGALWLVGWVSDAIAAPDPRPEFSSTEINQVLNFYFGTSDAADDASIKIIAPLITEHQALVPFKVEAAGAEKIAVVTTANPEPLILAMEQIRDPRGMIIGRARLEKTGILSCYVWRNGTLGRASQNITVAGHWRD